MLLMHEKSRHHHHLLQSNTQVFRRKDLRNGNKLCYLMLFLCMFVCVFTFDKTKNLPSSVVIGIGAILHASISVLII